MAENGKDYLVSTNFDISSKGIYMYRNIFKTIDSGISFHQIACYHDMSIHEVRKIFYGKEFSDWVKNGRIFH